MPSNEAAQRTADELSESEERFSLAMRGANDGLWDWNLETNDVYYSPRWKSMLGYEESELDETIDTWSNLVHPEDHQFALEKVKDYIEGRADSYEVEIRMHHKSGHYIFVLARAYLTHHDLNGKPHRLVGTHVDITERKKSEQFVVETSNILEMIATGKPASNIYDAIALLYESRHPGLRCSMLVLEGDTLMHGGAPSLPKEYCDAVNGLKNGPDVGSCGTSTYTGQSVFVENIETDPKWAKIKQYALPHGLRSCWSEPIKDASDKVLGAFGMYYDHPALPNEEEINDLRSAARLAAIIMNRDNSEKELYQHRQNLKELVSKRTLEAEALKLLAERANRAKSEFLASMSHELRTPLNAVMGFAQLLEFNPNEPLTEKQKENVLHIMKGGHHLLELINQVLELNMIEAGKMSLTLDHCSAREVIDESLQMINGRAIKEGITILDQTPKDGLPILWADSTRLTQVLLNLFSNAVKYNRKNGKVMLTCLETSDQMLRITVEDTGEGIPKNKQSALFLPFERLGREAGDIEGTGIGLTLTKQIIELLGGKIGFESEEGKGSRFWIDVPISGQQEKIQCKTEALQEPPAPTNCKSNDGTIRTVLYVEDNQANLQLMETIISRMENVKLLTAVSAELGIEIANRKNPDLILMDINLPGINGIQALKQLQEAKKTKDIPVFAVSAAVMPTEVEAGLKAGFKDYITKPIDTSKLIETIEETLRN